MALRKKIVRGGKFFIDCSVPVQEGLLDLGEFTEFLTARIKIDGKTGHVGQEACPITVSVDGDKIVLVYEKEFSKRYLKYLTKKFLKKESVKDIFRVVATNRKTYQIRHFNVVEEEEDLD
eukprot:TRINITY_DN11395_c0_g1_i2.p2 TRINITY_DN11395_c0_g1~~TRINITY_DN11395_c0_g1_i2.p2  ORF type:complete len:120 (-),score=38.96 TRINITY_DN11395_c0_g1_i2:323-682(-)